MYVKVNYKQQRKKSNNDNKNKIINNKLLIRLQHKTMANHMAKSFNFLIFFKSTEHDKK